MAKFISGANVNPFYRASQAPIDLLQSATADVMALSVPYVKITQVDPYTGKPLPKPPFMLDLVSAPAFDRTNNSGRFLERPLVSLESINIKSEAQIGLAKYELIDLSFVVHDPETVFFGDDEQSTFRAIIQEGNAFSLEYGWRGNCKNDLLNGIGFFDQDTGFNVPAITRMRILQYSWNASFDPNGEMKLSVRAIQDGELALREAKLTAYLDLAGLEQDRLDKRKRPRADLPQQDNEGAESIVSILASLPVTVVKPHGEFYKFEDVLNALVAPAVSKSCSAMGYAGVDLYLGNFSVRCAKSAPNMGSKELAGKSIGAMLIPAKQLKIELGKLHAGGETVVLRNFIERMASIANDRGSWADDREGRTVPEIFVGSSTRQVGDSLNFVLFFADRHLSQVSDAEFERGDFLDPNDQSKENVLSRIRVRGIPILQFGRADSVIKECSFNTIVDDQMRGVFVDSAFKARKTQAQAVSLPDPLGRKGRSTPEDYAFFSGVQAEITMVGNFIFSWGQTVWLDIFNVHPISGLYDVVGIEDSISASGFVTKIKLTTRGSDPLNTRHRKSRAQIEQERADAVRVKR